MLLLPCAKNNEQISLKSSVSGIRLSKLHYFFNFFFYCHFSPPFQSFQVLTKWSISFLQCCLVRKGGLLSMSSNSSEINRKISVYYVEWRVVDLLTYLLTPNHACVAHRAATKSFQRCLSLASFSMVLQL